MANLSTPKRPDKQSGGLFGRKIALGAWAIAKGTLPIIGVTKENQVLDAVKAANITLSDEEVSSLEKVADSLELNVIRFWEKEMK